MDRRTTIKWVLAAGATWPLFEQRTAVAGTLPAQGYGTDPDLLADYQHRKLWPLTMTAAQRDIARVLADIIIPADERSPSASAVGVVEFVDEWVSAPYPDYQKDRAIVLDGFVWLDAEAARRFGKGFSDLDAREQHGICDDICDQSHASPPLKDAARFFARFRDLTAGGFYSTPAGRKDLDYIGNVPLARFEGPPPELLKSLGLG